MPSSVLQARSLPTESCRFLSLSSWKHKCQQTGPVQFWLNNQLVSSREGPTYSVEKGITCKGRSGQFQEGIITLGRRGDLLKRHLCYQTTEKQWIPKNQILVDFHTAEKRKPEAWVQPGEELASQEAITPKLDQWQTETYLEQDSLVLLARCPPCPLVD